MSEQKIAAFHQLLDGALQEVLGAKRLLAEFTARAVDLAGDKTDAPTTTLIDTLVGIATGSGRRAHKALVLANRERKPDWPPVAGHYVMMPLYEVVGDEVYAAPAVVFWMRFNNNLHAFNHRYDNAVARHRIEDVTRPQILNHILGSFDFYKIYADSNAPFPGYR